MLFLIKSLEKARAIYKFFLKKVTLFSNGALRVCFDIKVVPKEIGLNGFSFLKCFYLKNKSYFGV